MTLRAHRPPIRELEIKTPLEDKSTNSLAEGSSLCKIGFGRSSQFKPLTKTPQIANRSEDNYDSNSSKSDYMSDTEYKRRLRLRLWEANGQVPEDCNFHNFIRIWFSCSNRANIDKAYQIFLRQYGEQCKELKRLRSDNFFELSAEDLRSRTQALRDRGILWPRRIQKRQGVRFRSYEQVLPCSRRKSVFDERVVSRFDC